MPGNTKEIRLLKLLNIKY